MAELTSTCVGVHVFASKYQPRVCLIFQLNHHIYFLDIFPLPIYTIMFFFLTSSSNMHEGIFYPYWTPPRGENRQRTKIFWWPFTSITFFKTSKVISTVVKHMENKFRSKDLIIRVDIILLSILFLLHFSKEMEFICVELWEVDCSWAFVKNGYISHSERSLERWLLSEKLWKVICLVQDERVAVKESGPLCMVITASRPRCTCAGLWPRGLIGTPTTLLIELHMYINIFRCLVFCFNVFYSCWKVFLNDCV